MTTLVRNKLMLAVVRKNVRENSPSPTLSQKDKPKLSPFESQDECRN